MDDRFDTEGKRVYFVTELLLNPDDGKEYLHIKAKKEGLPFVVRRRIPGSMGGDLETLNDIGADMHMALDLAEEFSKIGNLAPLCEMEEEPAE